LLYLLKTHVPRLGLRCQPWCDGEETVGHGVGPLGERRQHASQLDRALAQAEDSRTGRGPSTGRPAPRAVSSTPPRRTTPRPHRHDARRLVRPGHVDRYDRRPAEESAPSPVLTRRDHHALVLEHALRPLFGFFQAMTLPVAIFASAGDFDGTVLLNPTFTDASRWRSPTSPTYSRHVRPVRERSALDRLRRSRTRISIFAPADAARTRRVPP
jgi:hypothetical protein